MVDFICMGLLDIWAAQTDNYTIKNSCTHWDSNTGPSAYEYSLSVVLLVEISIEYLNTIVLITFLLSVLLNFTIAWYHVEDVVKYFVVYYILLTLYSQQMS